MDSSASGSQVLVLLHEVDETGDGLGLEVDVSVQGQQVGVVGLHLIGEKAFGGSNLDTAIGQVVKGGN